MLDYEFMMNVSGAIFTACIIMICIFCYYSLFETVKRMDLRDEIQETLDIVNGENENV